MSEPQEVLDILDGLTDPTADEMYQAVREYDTRHVVAAVGAKADAAGGGGGGSLTCTVSEEPPVDPGEGDLWLRVLPNTDTYQLYVWSDSAWNAASAGVGAGGDPFPDFNGRRVGGLLGDPDDDNFSGLETDSGWANTRIKSVDEDGNVNSFVEVTASSVKMQYQSARLSRDDTGWRISGLPTIDPGVDGYLYIDPVTRALTVSDGL